MNIIAQVFGFIALLVYCISLFSKNREKLLKFLLICNIFYCLQYLMLDAYAALFVCFIGVVRSLIFMRYEKENIPIPLWVILLLISIVIYCGILSYNGFISLIPIITGVIYTIGVWQKDIKKLRVICVINSISWLFYNFKVKAYISICSSVIELIAVLFAIIKLDIKKDN